MIKHKSSDALPFGATAGIAPGNVESYSCDYDTVNETLYPNRSAFKSYLDGIYMGYKWQCVEFARRWLYVNKKLIFNDVTMAYEIFNLKTIRDLVNNTELPLYSFNNGSIKPPEPGSMLIWDQGGEFEETGHVAIITEVFNDRIRIVEQNMDFEKWPAGQNYSREIKAKIGSKGDFWLQCSYKDSSILGWVTQTSDSQYSNEIIETPKQLANLLLQQVPQSAKADLPWLNIANEDESAYVDMMGGHYLTSIENDFYRYFSISKSAENALESATDELHGLFMHATDYVLQHPELLSKFELPSSILPKVRQSWDNRLNQLVTSRFDFAMSENGLKVYEYNCDSASCYMETGKIQGKWAKHLGLKKGSDSGEALFKKLVDAWRHTDVVGTIHVLQDDDPEENYHALFMKSIIEAAGYKCVRIVGLDSLSWGENGNIVDVDGNIINWVWKTWAWESALSQLREDEFANLSSSNKSVDRKPLLSDVLLNKYVMVYEPMWTLIPSNKAILPVLWKLFPNHPLLLNTSFELTEDLKKTGYVIKPIVGRCGENIQLIDDKNQTLEEKGGAFAHQEQIYQQLFPLPYVSGCVSGCVSGYYVQISTFTAAGNYAGSGVRVDKSMIIGKDSDCMALRTYDDPTFLSYCDFTESFSV